MTDTSLPKSASSPAAELDLRGLKCPLPALRTRRRLDAMPVGSVIVVATTDPMAAIDIPHLVQTRGDRLLDTRQDGAVRTFRIEKTVASIPGAEGDAQRDR